MAAGLMLLAMGVTGNGWTQGPGSLSRVRFVMGTPLEITAFGPHAPTFRAVTAAFEEVERLDGVMSLYKGDSELSRLNREAARGPFPCSQDLWAVLVRSAEVHEASGDAFDPTAGSPRPGLGRVRLDPRARSVSFDGPGTRLDLGAIGKGYALDRAAAVLRREGVRAARLNFGGQVLAFGEPSEVILPEGPALALNDASASTSSQSERPGHIKDPRTGRPADRPGSVTVLAGSAADADAWSTALFVLGPRGAPASFPYCAFWTAPDVEPITAGDCRRYQKQERQR